METYELVVPMLADSNGTGTHWTTFLVRVATSDTLIYYDSAPDSGYAVDNLAPAEPSPLTAAYAGGSTNLHWGMNTESDLANYRLYRGSDPSFIPDAASLIASPSDTGYTDPGPAGSWYQLSAVDVNGNESAFAELGPDNTVSVGPGVAPGFALESESPNPAHGSLGAVMYSVSGSAPAEIEVGSDSSTVRWVREGFGDTFARVLAATWRMDDWVRLVASQ